MRSWELPPPPRVNIVAAFPRAQSIAAAKVQSAFRLDPFPTKRFCLFVGNDSLVIPYRVYSFVDPNIFGDRTDERKLLDCILTRHADGFVRESSLRRIVTLKDPWIPAFVVPLVGEYVVEILQVIEANSSSLDADIYGAFLLQNAAYFEIVKKRVESYWNAYYRRSYEVSVRPKRDYPGYKLIELFEMMRSS